jgi:two-component system LytT family response regulator
MPAMIKAILVDDEANSLSSLKEKLLAHCPQVKIIACCDNAENGIAAIDSLQPDIVFLDIEMPVMNGFIMLQQLTYKNFELVFTTAYDHYAIKAIRYSALDYLVKPIEIDDLKAAVTKAAAKRSFSYPNPQIELLVEQIINKKNTFSRIAIPTAEGLKFIKVEDIIYLEASGNYTHIFTPEKKKYIASHTLKDFEDMLPTEIFLRIHNSYIINKNFAEKYIRGEGGQVILSNGTSLEVSKRKKSEFLKAIGY